MNFLWEQWSPDDSHCVSAEVKGVAGEGLVKAWKPARPFFRWSAMHGRGYLTGKASTLEEAKAAAEKAFAHLDAQHAGEPPS